MYNPKRFEALYGDKKAATSRRVNYARSEPMWALYGTNYHCNMVKKMLYLHHILIYSEFVTGWFIDQCLLVSRRKSELVCLGGHSAYGRSAMRIFSRSVAPSAGLALFVLFGTTLCLGGELIPPTRTLEGTEQMPGTMSVLSEPPGLKVFLDGSNMGKTPVRYKKVRSGYHTLQVQDAETDIYLGPGKRLQISLFKGSFIMIPSEEKEGEKQPSPAQGELTEPSALARPAKERREKDLSLWERYVNGSSPLF